MPRSIYGYETRKPYPSELNYFKKNPRVSGMAASDRRIILNPYSKLNPQQYNTVAKNEAIRLWLREKNIKPKFQITPEQLFSFRGSEYGKPENRLPLKRSIIARALSGDPSAGVLTLEQNKSIKGIRNQLLLRSYRRYGYEPYPQ